MENKKKNVYIYVYDRVNCCTAEIGTTLEINYPLIKKINFKNVKK